MDFSLCPLYILQQRNPSNYPGDADQSNLADQYFGRGNSPMTCGNTISGNTFISNGTDTRNKSVGGGFVTNTNTGETFCSIQAAIDDAQTLAGHTITVSAGTYNEDVNVTKSVTVSGADATTTIVSGPIGGGNATFRVSASGVIIENFTITRDGNNLTDWNDPTLNSAGVAIQSQGNTATIRNNIITGNRTGIDINNANGNTITENQIDFNRTGLLFRNQTDNTTMTNNFIRDNWTVGVLFLDGSGGTNVPVQSAVNSNFNDNNISGNWYGDIVDRQSGGSLPVPGSNIKNFDCNWYGVTSPVVSTNNSNEPGYSSQIPVAYGGIATNPGNAPNILGPASANFDYISWLTNGTDDQPSTQGFQPVSGTCTGTLVNITSTTPSPETCVHDNGSIAIVYSGGTANYTITWSGQESGSDVTSNTTYTIPTLSAGSYNITITDANGSTATTAMVTVGYNPVTNLNTSATYATIQGAVDAATTGDVIEVCAGTYTEAVTVNKAVTIKGANAGIAAGNDSGSRGAETILDGAFKMNAAGTIDGFKIINGYQFGGSPNEDGILVASAGVTVTNSIVEDVTGNQNTGIEVGYHDNFTMTNSSIINNWRGIYLNPSSGHVLSGNLIDGNSYGISSDGLANFSMTGSSITNNSQEGWGASSVGSNVVANNNIIANNPTVSIAHYGGSAIDANCNWWGQNTGVVSGQVTGNVTTIPYLNDGTDNAPGTPGFQPAPNSCVGPVHNLTQDTYYATIQSAVNAANANDVIEAADGTYNERVTINKSLTLQGESEAGVILNGTGLSGTGSGIYINNGITNVTIKTLTIQNYNGNNPNGSAGIYAALGNNGFKAEHVTVKNNTNASGIYANGPVNGFEVTYTTVSGHGPGARGIVIWNGLKQNISLNWNTVFNNNCCGIELQDGSASGVTIFSNTVFGNTDSGISAVGLTSGAGPNLISNNYLENNGRFGVEIKNPLGTGLETGDGSIVVSENDVSLTLSFLQSFTDTRDLAGISVYRRAPEYGAGNPDVPQGVVIKDNFVKGYKQSSNSDGFGIAVEGMSHTIKDNTLQRNDVGLQFQVGHTPYTGVGGLSDAGDQSNLNDQYFGRGNAAQSCNIVDGGQTYGVGNALANGTNFRIVGFSNNGMGGFATNINTGKVFCSIQSAIDDSLTQDGDIIEVSAGTFAEAVTVNKAVTIKGANAGIAAGNDPGNRGAESIVDGGFYITKTATIDGFEIINGSQGLGGGPNKDGMFIISDGVTVTNSIISDVSGSQNTGIEVSYNNNFTLTNSSIINNWRGIYLNPSSGHVLSGNLIGGNSYGISSDGLTNFSMTGSTISNNHDGSNTGEGWGASSVGVGVIANENIFINNDVSIANYGGSTIDAQCNWWGQNTGVVSGQVTGNVTTIPYLNDGTDNAPGTPGFQPAGTCFGPVHNETQDIYYATIQLAIDAANDHDVITATAGIYNEDIIIDKPLTLNGANKDIACGSRGAESIISPLTSGQTPIRLSGAGVSDNVTINGFEITGTMSNNAIYAGADGASNLTIKYNNIHHIGTDRGSGNVYAINFRVNNPSVIGPTISNNCFNEIFNTTTALGNSAAIWIGQSTANGTVTGTNISNNTISNVKTALATKYAAGIDIGVAWGSGTGGLTNTVIENNSITGVDAGAGIGYGIQLSGKTPQTTFIHNIIDGVTGSIAGVGVAVPNTNTGYATITITENSLLNMPLAITNGNSGVLTATCNWYGSATYADINAKVAGLVIFTNYLLNNDLYNPTCGGGHTTPANLNLTYTQAAEDLFVEFDTTLGDMVLNPIPGLDPNNPGDQATIAGLYLNLMNAIISNDSNAILLAALAVGDDVITEYYYFDNNNNKVYLQTINNNPLVKNKYWQKYLVDTGNNRYPDWINSVSNVNIDNYRTNTNPNIGSVAQGWLDDVLGKDLYVTVTTIQNGHVEQITNHVAIDAGPVTNTRTGSTYATIQKGIDSANTLDGDTLTVAPGLYAENITVDKAITILGPNATIDPCTETRGGEAIIVPATSDILDGALFDVLASDVTISGFTLDGDNSGITTGFSSTNGADIDTSTGIQRYITGDNLVITNNIIQNISYMGILMYDYPTAVPSAGNIVANNKIRDLGTYDVNSGIDDWGRGILLYNNQYAYIHDNCLENVAVGIQTGNFSKVNPGDTDYQMIINNTIEAREKGIFHNSQYSNASEITLSGNTITGLMNANETNWKGIMLSSLSVPSTTVNNNIDGSGITNTSWGIEVWSVKSSSPASISEGFITGVETGINVTNYDDYYGNGANGAHATIAQVTISGAATGIQVQDSPSSTSHAAVSTSIANNFISAPEGVKLTEATTGKVSGNINENHITGFTTYAINGAVNNSIDANCNWYGDSNINVVQAAINGANVDYQPWLINGTDDEPGTSGFQPVPNSCSCPGGTITNQDTGETFCTIQSAIDDSDTINGHTIIVEAGTYNESDIVVGKSVTIIGAGQGTTIINPDPNKLDDGDCSSAIAGNSHSAFILTSDGVSIKDLTIDGSGHSPYGYRNGIINKYWDAKWTNNIEVNDVTIQNVNYSGITLKQDSGNGKLTGNKVTGSTISTDSCDNGYGIEAFRSDIDLYDNTVTGFGFGIAIRQNNESYAGLAHIERNIVNDSNYQAFTLTSLIAGSTFENNTITHSDPNNQTYGIVTYRPTVEMKNNTIGGVNYGMFIGRQDLDKSKLIIGEGNVFIGNGTGSYGLNVSDISWTNYARNFTMTGTEIKNYEYGVYFDQVGTMPVDMLMEHNRIYDNQIGLWNYLPQQLDVSNNWWGDASGPYNDPYNHCGTGNEVGGDIIFSPWCADGNCNGTNTLDITAPILVDVTPAAGGVCLNNQNFVWTVQASDPNLYSLEIDHSMEGQLPEFTVYADSNDPTGGHQADFNAAGVSVTYNAVTQTWSFDFGQTITDAFVQNGGITFYTVLKDCNGNQTGSMDPTTPANTFAYTISTQSDAGTISSAEGNQLCTTPGEVLHLSTDGDLGGVWSSSNEAWATVDQNGVVTALLGEQTITITYTVAANGACPADTSDFVFTTLSSPNAPNETFHLCQTGVNQFNQPVAIFDLTTYNGINQVFYSDIDLLNEITNPDTYEATNDTYVYVKLTNNNGCTSNATITLKVDIVPVYTATLNSNVIVDGGSATYALGTPMDISIVAGTGDHIVVTHEYNNVTYTVLDGYDSISQNFTMDLFDEGEYFMTITSDKGCITTGTFTLNIFYPEVMAKVLLQGALVNVNDASQYDSDSIMRDDIRSKGLLPATQPYGAIYGYNGTETVADPLTVFGSHGDDSVVDWVLLELRDANNPATVVATRAALVQKDGDIVDVDGVSSVSFTGANVGSYYLAVRHRNHLGAMSFDVLDMTQPVSFDFRTDKLYTITGRKESPAFKQTQNGNQMLWAGDVNHNGKIVLTAQDSDKGALSVYIKSHPNNGFHAANFIWTEYSVFDSNMNGISNYSASGNDTNIIQQNIKVNSTGNIFHGNNYVLFLSNLP